MVIRVLCLLLASAVFAYADNNVPTIANDFVFTFFSAYRYPSDSVLLALVSNNNNGTANVVVTSSYSSFTTIRVSVAPYSVLKIPITPVSIQDQFPNYNNNGRIVVENKGIRLQSDLPVAVYAHSELSEGFSADSFMVIPAIHLGMQYVAITSTQPLESASNVIAVVAYQDNTKVTIGSQTVTINALQVASVASFAVLSGTAISGNKPFGVISGCSSGSISWDGGSGYEAVMLLPVGVWGTQFAAIPFLYLTTNYYQVVANTDHTVVSAGSTVIATLYAGEYRRFQIGAALVSSNYPIQLIQIGQYTGSVNNDLGSPFFLQLPSTDRMSNTNVLFQPTGYFEDDDEPLVFVLRIVTNLAGSGTIELCHILMEEAKAVDLSAPTAYQSETPQQRPLQNHRYIYERDASTTLSCQLNSDFLPIHRACNSVNEH
uniref:IgGFc-binding protein N-terminal domain-containing protein n=1 Tax=Plectus sambesii TaxID=2011161 RepID=A0A914VP80_9BILA